MATRLSLHSVPHPLICQNRNKKRETKKTYSHLPREQTLHTSTLTHLLPLTNTIHIFHKGGQPILPFRHHLPLSISTGETYTPTVFASSSPPTIRPYPSLDTPHQHTHRLTRTLSVARRQPQTLFSSIGGGFEPSPLTFHRIQPRNRCRNRLHRHQTQQDVTIENLGGAQTFQLGLSRMTTML